MDRMVRLGKKVEIMGTSGVYRYSTWTATS
jgi:hypothetical protein